LDAKSLFLVHRRSTKTNCHVAVWLILQTAAGEPQYLSLCFKELFELVPSLGCNVFEDWSFQIYETDND
jgi:hypothetical protein